MKRVILCEGKTDAILIGYFLEKFGWKYIKNKVIELPVDRDNEMAKWYCRSEKPNMELVIWGVGGIDRMSVKLQQVIERTQNERDNKNRFEQIVLFFDKDNRNEDECKDLLEDWLGKCNDFEISGSLQLGEWLDAKTKLRDNSRSIYEMRIIAIALPPDSKGNLETFLIDAMPF